jgi:hypothetical protein
MDAMKAHGADCRCRDVERRSRLPKNLRIGVRYRVSGILHEYLGSAHLPDKGALAHVFLRNEWPPDTPGQLPLTLVKDTAVDQSVTKTR